MALGVEPNATLPKCFPYKQMIKENQNAVKGNTVRDRCVDVLSALGAAGTSNTRVCPSNWDAL